MRELTFRRLFLALMKKEWLQLRRSRSALATAVFLPALVLVGAPMGQISGRLALGRDPMLASMLRGAGLPPGALEMILDPGSFVRGVMPVLVALGGLIVPAVMATHTVIAERESRTLELLAALPVRVSTILHAKLLVILLVSAVISGTCLAVDSVRLVTAGLASLGYVLGLYLLLGSALVYSAASALLTALLSKDFRAANNINGTLLAPTVMLALGVVAFVPGDYTRILLLSGLYGLGALIATVISLRIVTFERLLA